MKRAKAEASSTVLVHISGWHRAMELSGIRLDLLAQTRFLFFSNGPIKLCLTDNVSKSGWGYVFKESSVPDRLYHRTRSD